jgi:APA family basic amino acid/polyamine antiporter
MPLEEMRRTKAVPQAIMAGILGDWAAGALGACIMASVFGALNGNVLTKPRVAYALAQDGLTFAALGRVHPKWGTPVVALVVQGAASVLLIFLLADRENPGGLFDALTTYFVVVEWFALLFAVGAVIVLRKRQPDTPRPFRTPLYPWVPLVFLVGTAYGLWEIVRGEIAREKPNWAPVWGLLVAMAGFPIYWAWRRSADRRPGGTAG